MAEKKPQCNLILLTNAHPEPQLWLSTNQRNSKIRATHCVSRQEIVSNGAVYFTTLLAGKSGSMACSRMPKTAVRICQIFSDSSHMWLL